VLLDNHALHVTGDATAVLHDVALDVVALAERGRLAPRVATGVKLDLAAELVGGPCLAPMYLTFQ